MDQKTNEFYRAHSKTFLGFHFGTHIDPTKNNDRYDIFDTFLESFFYIVFTRIYICDILHIPDYKKRNAKTKERRTFILWGISRKDYGLSHDSLNF